MPGDPLAGVPVAVTTSGPVPPVPAPAGPSVVSEVATVAAGVAEAVVPALLPYAPLISLALSYIRGYFDATGNLPDDATVIAALPKDIQALNNLWASWVPSGK